jgi:hypothetical protein
MANNTQTGKKFNQGSPANKNAWKNQQRKKEEAVRAARQPKKES